jgi:peptide/nickel transport system ATP-binding protein
MTASSPQPVLSIRQLSVSLPAGGDRVHAVHQASLTIHPGQTLCVVGESGSGKSVMATTVMGLLAKELQPSGGEVLLQGGPCWALRRSVCGPCADAAWAWCFRSP